MRNYLKVLVFVLIASCSSYEAINYRDLAGKTEKIDGSENLRSPIKVMLFEEQNLHVKNLWRKGAFASNISPEYLPEENPKFPIAYYLIPVEDSHFTHSESLDPRVYGQISFKDSNGRIFYKLFVHPESEDHYSFLKNSYAYVSQEQSEFTASPTSSYRSLVLWNNNDPNVKPFIAKVSLDRNIIRSIDRLVSVNEVERSLANQKAFDQIGSDALDSMNAKIFPETAGLTISKKHADAPEKLGGQLIREIPEEVWTGHKKWVAWATLISPERGPPMILDVIRASNLSSRDFVEKYMIDGFMKMFEDLSLSNGINFEPHSQNLGLELNPDNTTTGKWVIKDFGGVWPDIVTMDKVGKSVESYLGEESADKFKLLGGRTNAINSFVFFYKRQVFDFLLREIAKHDPSFDISVINNLRRKIDIRFVQIVRKHFDLNLSQVPTMNNYESLVSHIRKTTKFSISVASAEVESNMALSRLVMDRYRNNQWVELTESSGPYKYYISKNVLYKVAGENIAGFTLFSQDELVDYELRLIKLHAPSSCFEMMGQLVQ